MRSAKPEHWAKKLKRELAIAKAEVRVLVRDPNGHQSTMIRCRVNLEDDINERIWFGSYGGGGSTNGLLDKMGE